MGCSGAYATKEQYSEWWGYYQYAIDLTKMTAEEQASLDNQLKMAAGRIHLALQQVGACDCALSDAALDFLKQVNIVATAVMYRAPAGPRLTGEDAQFWLEWVGSQLTLIETGKIDMCGSTSADFPAADTAQYSWTEFNAARLIRDRALRKLG